MSRLQEAVDQRRLEKELTHLPYSLGKSPTPCLCIKASDGKEWLFPWVHLTYGCYSIESENDSLSLIYSSHEVVIAGQNLTVLKEAVSRFVLEQVRPAPVHFGTVTDGETVIYSVRVRGVEKAPKQEELPKTSSTGLV